MNKRQIKNIFSHVSYSKKLFFSYFTITCVVLGVFSYNSYRRSSHAELQQSLYTATNALSQSSEFIGYKIQSVKNIVNTISNDDHIQTVISNSENYDRSPQNNWIIVTETAKGIMYNANVSNDILDIRLYPLSGEHSFESSDTFMQLTEKEKERWYDRNDNAEKRNSLLIPPTLFSSSDSLNSIMFVKRIPNSENINHCLGTLTAAINPQVIKDILNQTATTRNTSVVLYNSYDEVVMHKGGSSSISPAEAGKKAAGGLASSSGKLEKVTYEGRQYYIGTRTIEGTDWTLATSTPAADIFKTSRASQLQLFFSFLLLTLLLIPVLSYISKSLSSRIYKLERHIDEAIDTNFEIAPLVNGNDEIGTLTNHFNSMVKQISVLLKEQYSQGYKIKELEFQVLQSQINPHFLYNSLDMIYWLGLDHGVPEIADAAKELGRFYMRSLGHGETIVSLRSELEHVGSYVKIQNMRFDNKIKLKIDVPADLMESSIIKIILQPLVENSILHGIRENPDERGTISIRGTSNGDVIKLTISDNGVGMTNAELNNILKHDTDNSSYGVWNIHERIQLTYGAGYGLSYKSKEGTGTEATLCFPKI